MFKQFLGFPYFALVLMLLTYTLFGWQWFERGYLWHQQWQEHWHQQWGWSHFFIVFWSLIALMNLGVIGTMTAPLAFVRRGMLKLFESDTRSFILALGFSFFAIFLVVYLNITLEWMVLLAALMLARLELQDHHCNEWIAFWLLAIVAMMGLGLGGISHYYLPMGIIE